MKRSVACVAVLSAALTLTGVCLKRPVAAQEVSFACKTVNMTIGFAAGGGVEQYGRTMGRHLVQKLPGNPSLVVLNKPGAGGVVALNDWSRRADTNGLSLT